MTTTPYDGVIWRKGPRVLLRPVEQEDVSHVHRWINDPRINRFVLSTYPLTYLAEERWFDEMTKGDDTKITVAVCTHDGTLMGTMSLRIDLAKQAGTTGTLFGTAFQGQGFGTEAKMLLLDYAFNWRGLRKVTSKILAINGRSQRYAGKCGHRHVATIPQEHFREGRWIDEEVYVVFREEWIPLWEAYRSALPEDVIL
ncbi:GNAT family N-acetyltransferase [Patescibacteria group bacterium]|jgi:RimJ/RimL family protein N-acetyltransferase|nr:GNAT family N-acetyltransferase [Patescibacteria group bacterium]